MDEEECKPLEYSSEDVSGRDLKGSSLMPMLFAGLILVGIGYVAVMIFV